MKIINYSTAIFIEIIVMSFSYITFSHSFGIGRIVVTFINGLVLGYLGASIVYRNYLNILEYKLDKEKYIRIIK